MAHTRDSRFHNTINGIEGCKQGPSLPSAESLHVRGESGKPGVWFL